MSRKVELPLGTPFYTTYHFQGLSGAVSPHTQNVRNWYLNESVQLNCNKIFLYGFSSPHLTIDRSSWTWYPHFDKYIYPTRFLDDNTVLRLICQLLDHGYYVNFDGVDDYYLEGKTWYHERHFCHDGLIYGYDEAAGTFDVFAYDQNWLYTCFQIRWDSFLAGRASMTEQGLYGTVCGVKPKDVCVEVDPQKIDCNLQSYLASAEDGVRSDGPGEVSGVVVHQYVMRYLDRLYQGAIPYDKMDWRVFHVIWEHKRFMLERIRKAEAIALPGNAEFGDRYLSVVRMAEQMKGMYAVHHRKRRDFVLPGIKDLLVRVDSAEKEILQAFLLALEKTKIIRGGNEE